MRIEISKGLKISKIIYELFLLIDKNTNNENLGNSFINIGTFTNCRECGYTYMCMADNGETFTFCTYEHRNSDEIIINGKKGYISLNGELPYKGNDSHTYLFSAPSNEHYKVAEQLYKFITKFFTDNMKNCEE